MALKIAGVYLIRNTQNGKVYVGQSRNIRQRWTDHRKALRRSTHPNPHLQASWCKYGEASFEFEVVQQSEVTQLALLEQEWVHKLGSCDREKGYNLSTPTPSGYTMSAETRARIGAANRGKVRTPEMRVHMSAVKKGQGKGREKSEMEVVHLRAAHARRAADPGGYAWCRSPEGRELLRTAGKKGSASRWGEANNGA